MKSTIKIDYSSRSDASLPVIKIIQPNDSFNDTNVVDFDVRDKLIRDFLERPGYVDRNYWFELDSCFGNDKDSPSLFISTIAAIREEDLLERFKYAILNRFVPYESLIGFNRDGVREYKEGDPIPRADWNYKKIVDFFDWLKGESRPSWNELQPERDRFTYRP